MPDDAALRRAIEMLEQGATGPEVDEVIEAVVQIAEGVVIIGLPAPAYSTSIDAAARAVPYPKHFTWKVDSAGNARVDSALCGAFTNQDDATKGKPAAALCLAACRARLAISEQEGK